MLFPSRDKKDQQFTPYERAVLQFYFGFIEGYVRPLLDKQKPESDKEASQLMVKLERTLSVDQMQIVSSFMYATGLMKEADVPKLDIDIKKMMDESLSKLTDDKKNPSTKIM